MSHYRRLRFGPTYFFTVISCHRRPILCDDIIRKSLRDAFNRFRTRLPFTVDAMVLLPDHLHCVWTLLDKDFDVSARWAQIKHHVSCTCRHAHDDFVKSESGRRRGESAIWQRRFWEHLVKDEYDMQKHVDYIHYNPVKHGHAPSAAAWPYSSFRRYVRQGIYPADWGGTDAARGMMLE